MTKWEDLIGLYPEWTEEELTLLLSHLKKWGWTEEDLIRIMKMYSRAFLLDAARIYRSACKHCKGAE
jgi:hypothetical protein